MNEEIDRLKAENKELRVKLGQALMDLDWYKGVELRRIKQGYENQIRELKGEVCPQEGSCGDSE